MRKKYVAYAKKHGANEPRKRMNKQNRSKAEPWKPPKRGGTKLAVKAQWRVEGTGGLGKKTGRRKRPFKGG